jgi:UDP-N-acetyl-D-glucosamine dehydrogenase
MTNHFEELRRKIETHSAHVGVVGLGYVGLPLVVEFAHAGFCVTGIDVQQSKVDAINRGESYIQDIPTSALEPYVKAGKVRATTDFSVVKDLDTINICVPTPLRKTKDPDMSFIVNACQEIAKHFHPGTLVILESTTYPGTTDELMWTPATPTLRPRIVPQWWAASRPLAPKSVRCFTSRRSIPWSRWVPPAWRKW